MQDFPARFADLLETVASKFRAMTVDRVTKAMTMVAMGIPVLVLALLAVIFLFMTIHGALAVPLGSAAGFGVMAGLFAIGGWLLWRKRTSSDEEST